MNRKEFDRVERRKVKQDDFKDAFKMMLQPKRPSIVGNREPTEEEIKQRFRLDRKDQNE